MSKWFAWQHSVGMRGVVPVVFDERPEPGKRNARDIVPGSVRQLPDHLYPSDLHAAARWAAQGDETVEMPEILAERAPLENWSA